MQILSFKCSALLEGQNRLLVEGAPLDNRLCEAFGAENVYYEGSNTVIVKLKIDATSDSTSEDIAIKTSYFWDIITYFSR